MKNGIIDIGSNSVRLLYCGKKYMENTQLAEGLMNSGCLKKESMERTADAVAKFAAFAKSRGANAVYAFATEAVRSATNGSDFVDMITERGTEIEVLPSSMEAKAGFYGAYTGGRVAVLDIGGASSELTVGDENGIIYSYSLPLGSVRLKDYGVEREEQESYARMRVKEYGTVPAFDKLIAIGGTVSQLYAVYYRIEPYDAERIHGSIITYAMIKQAVDKILATPIEDRTAIKGLHPKKILVAPAGGILALEIMKYLNIDEVTVSERDNLEGYAALKNIEV